MKARKAGCGCGCQLIRDPIYVSTEEAALYIGVSIRTIYRWYSNGLLTKHGGASHRMARWDLRELDRALHRVSRCSCHSCALTPDTGL